MTGRMASCVFMPARRRWYAAPRLGQLRRSRVDQANVKLWIGLCHLRYVTAAASACTIFNEASGTCLCSAFASSHGAGAHTSRSSASPLRQLDPISVGIEQHRDPYCFRRLADVDVFCERPLRAKSGRSRMSDWMRTDLFSPYHKCPRDRATRRAGGGGTAMLARAVGKDHSRPWNKGLLIGQKKPLQPKHVWSIRVRLEIASLWRGLALFNLAIDSKLRACDLVKLPLDEVFS
jgi:hypothetical protein